jgi:tetratricopeptide (TPR) repeat protein
MMKRVITLQQTTNFSTLICVSLIFCLIESCSQKEKKDVLVLGTIHNFHANSKYSYSDVLDILGTYKPDLICVEIRPEDFREKPYLTEMMLATAFGDLGSIPVEPIDWWDEKNNDRLIADSLGKTDKYIRLMNINDSLTRTNEILNAFSKKYGENIYTNNDLDIDFWNGQDYSNCVRESYKISLSVFGDSPFNLRYVTRNRQMLKLIEEGIQKHDAKRIIVLTGCEHKCFFEDSLGMNKNINVLTVESIKPVTGTDKNEYWTKMRPELYFNSNDSSKTEDYYSSLDMPLFHGMRMDLDISNINPGNLPQIEIILKNWQQDAPNSVKLMYDWAWYYFLNKEYDNSIKYASLYLDSKKYESTNFKDWGAYRIIAFCYDLKNEHDRAIGYYRKARESMNKLNMNPKFAELFLSDYENKPYKREQ